MKKIMYLIVFVLLVGCGSEGGGTNDTPIIEKVTIVGNMYNLYSSDGTLLKSEPTQAEVSYAPVMPATIERFADVVRGQMIEIATSITNTGTVPITNAQWKVEIEDDIFLTAESWVYNQCYAYGQGGQACNGLIEVIGGDINNPATTPDMSTCNEVEAPQPNAGYCVDVFDDVGGLACSDPPTYSVEYNMSGSGFWEATSSFTLAVGETFSGTVGFGHTAINAKPDHIARWSVTDTGGKSLGIKEYLFNVVTSIN